MTHTLSLLVQAYMIADSTIIYLTQDGQLQYYPTDLVSYECRLLFPVHASKLVDQHPFWGTLPEKRKQELLKLLMK